MAKKSIGYLMEGQGNKCRRQDQYRTTKHGQLTQRKKTVLAGSRYTDGPPTDTTTGTILGGLMLDLKSLFLAGKWLDCDQSCTRWSTGEPASRVCSRSRSRSKVTCYGHFCPRPKIAFSRRQMARLRPNLHTMVPRCACIQGVLKVKVKVKCHVIQALLCWT